MLVGKKARFAVELLLPSHLAAERFIQSLSEAEQAAAVANRLADMLSAPVKVVKGS